MKTSAVQFNPYRQDFVDNPYPHYCQLREADPVHKSAMGTWVLSRYDDISRLLRDVNFSSSPCKWAGFEQRYQSRAHVDWMLKRQLLNVDPPRHTALKRQLTRAFSSAEQGDLERTVRRIAERQVRALRVGDAGFDAIESFALRVPVEVICHLYQIAFADRQRVKQWSLDVSRLIEPLPSLAALEDADRSIGEFKRYLQSHVHDLAQRGVCGRNFPARLSALVEAGEMGREDMLANLILMFPAGHETTVNLIGNGLLSLLRHPQQMQQLRRQPELMPQAIEEMLRYEPPQQIAWRTATDACQIRGRSIHRGDQLMLLLGAGNRDPEAFARPSEFDIERPQGKTLLSFGLGRHVCVGAWFARMQAAIALSVLLQELPAIELDGSPCWYQTLSFRGLKSLPVRVTAGDVSARGTCTECRGGRAAGGRCAICDL